MMELEAAYVAVPVNSKSAEKKQIIIYLTVQIY